MAFIGVPNRPLRILAVGHSYILAVNRATARHLANDPAFEVTVAAPRYFHGDLRRLQLEEEPAGSAVKLVPLNAYGSRFIHTYRYAGRALKHLLTNGGFDVVHVWEEPYIYAGFQICRMVKRYSRAKLVFRTAQNLSKRYLPPFNFLERWTLQRADGWIAGGQSVFDTMVTRGYDPARGRVLSPGVDLSLFQPLSPALKARGRAELDLLADSPLIGLLGRLTPAKGVSVLLQAVERLPAELPWALLFLGSGKEEANILRWAHERGWRERVRVRLVRHDEVPRFLGIVDVLAAPSQTTRQWKEQFGRMVIEAFACGVPVIGSDSGELPNVIGDAGIIVPEDDVDRWTAALAATLTNSEQREMLARRSLARVQRFSAASQADQHAAFYHQLHAGELEAHSPADGTHTAH